MKNGKHSVSASRFDDFAFGDGLKPILQRTHKSPLCACCTPEFVDQPVPLSRRPFDHRACELREGCGVKIPNLIYRHPLTRITEAGSVVVELANGFFNLDRHDAPLKAGWPGQARKRLPSWPWQQVVEQQQAWLAPHPLPQHHLRRLHRLRQRAHRASPLWALLPWVPP